MVCVLVLPALGFEIMNGTAIIVPSLNFDHDMQEALGTVNLSRQSRVLLPRGISPDNTDGKTFWCEIDVPALISQIIPAIAPRARVQFLLFV